MDITAEKGRITLDKFTAISGDLNVTAKGDIDEDDKINLDMDAYNLDLTLLQPWTGIAGVTGLATVTVIASGPIKQPEIQVSVEIVSPVIGGVKLDRIHTSEVAVTGS